MYLQWEPKMITLFSYNVFRYKVLQRHTDKKKNVESVRDH